MGTPGSGRVRRRAEFADLLFQALEPSHLAAETNNFFDELCYISFCAIQTSSCSLMCLCALTVMLQVNMSISMTSTAVAIAAVTAMAVHRKTTMATRRETARGSLFSFFSPFSGLVH